jgi:hypothetical protein
MKEKVFYWPRADMILIRYVVKNSLFGTTIGWSCDHTSLYWSDILDHTDEFILLGDL